MAPGGGYNDEPSWSRNADDGAVRTIPELFRIILVVIETAIKAGRGSSRSEIRTRNQAWTVPNDVTTPGSRSPLSAGLHWASRITSLGLMFALPTLAGVYIDRQFGSNPIGTLVGSVVGFATGMVQLLQIARGGQKPKPTSGTKRRRP